MDRRGQRARNDAVALGNSQHRFGPSRVTFVGHELDVKIDGLEHGTSTPLDEHTGPTAAPFAYDEPVALRVGVERGLQTR